MVNPKAEVVRLTTPTDSRPCNGSLALPPLEDHGEEPTTWVIGQMGRCVASLLLLIVACDPATFHHLGKVEAPISVLGKAGFVTDEFFMMKAHSVVGADLDLKAAPDTENISRGVWGRQDRLDGGSYPDGLKVEGIRFSVALFQFHCLFMRHPPESPPISHACCGISCQDHSRTSFDSRSSVAICAVKDPIRLAS